MTMQQQGQERNAADLHIPVLMKETLAALQPVLDAGRDRPVRILDGTLGMAGHSSAMLQAAPQGELCALDRDEEALELARRRLEPFGGRVHTYHCRYSQFEEALDDLGWDKVFSIMGRHVARAEEALLIANAVEGWLKEVKPDGETFTPFEIPQSAEGYGCTEAPRGSLVHYIRVKDQKIDSYQIISATLWNCSPRDDKGRRGPLEEALIGVQVPDINNPVNVGRTIRAFDP